ncbi:MAG: DUF2505 domain-containing protein [Hellea sp.]|nr:DUF2505 domain-containing protein [Hellea sp.]
MKTFQTKNYTQGVDEIGAAFLDADFLAAKFEAMGSRNIEITVEALDDDEFQVTIVREAPVDVPRALKSVVKPWNKIVQNEHWSGADGGPYRGEIELGTDGVPAELSSVIEIEQTGSGCSCTVTNEITCKIPLIGKKLAQFIAKEAEKTVDEEYEYISQNA